MFGWNETKLEGSVETRRSVQGMNDDTVLATFGTGADAETRGFDEATHTRVVATEMVRARQRLSHYRTLYASFLEAGEPVMIENLDEGADAGAIPAKLVFTDSIPVGGGAEAANVTVWTEATLLEALVRERTIADYFMALLDELEPAQQSS
jgi:hypothetical protein